MLLKRILSASVFCSILCIACNNETKTDKTTSEDTNKAPSTKEEAVSYTSDSTTLNGYITYDENREGKRPIVLVVHEWWGLTDYVRNRAKQLAELGYLAMAVDMFGGKIAANPQEAQNLATPFYQDPSLGQKRLEAALAKIKAHPQADTTQTAAIGYCFGGTMVLNSAKLGSHLDGVVSFHGGLAGPPANKDLLKAKVLVCHGGADPFVSQAEVDAFKKGMDSINADYTFKVYPNSTHAFTNPAATENGKKFNLPIAYNGAADSASWNDMKDFFGKIFK